MLFCAYFIIYFLCTLVRAASYVGQLLTSAKGFRQLFCYECGQQKEHLIVSILIRLCMQTFFLFGSDHGNFYQKKILNAKKK